jgi:hypothetical protein
MMAMLGSRRAKRALDDAPARHHFVEMGTKIGIEQKQSREESGK